MGTIAEAGEHAATHNGSIAEHIRAHHEHAEHEHAEHEHAEHGEHDEAEEYEEGKDMPAHAEPTEFVQKHNHTRLRNLSRHLARHHNMTIAEAREHAATHNGSIAEHIRAHHEHAEHEHAEHEHAEHDEAEEYEEGKDMPAPAEPTEFLQKHNHSLKNLTRHAKHAEHDHAEHEHAEHEHDDEEEAEHDDEEAEDKPAHAEPTEFVQKRNHSLKNLTRHARHTHTSQTPKGIQPPNCS